MESIAPYQSRYKIRFVTAASLFDGHDATINIMRRILQSSGAEVIHLGHNRSVDEVVNCAIQEDVQGIALTSYQGGHLEYFKYMHDLLVERGAGHIKIFGGGGGVFLPQEIEELQAYGISRIYSPDDGRTMGLQGMINDMLQQCDFPTVTHLNGEMDHLPEKDPGAIARLISMAENNSLPAPPKPSPEGRAFENKKVSPTGGDLEGAAAVVLGITGTGGSGKSSLVDEIVRRFLMATNKTLAIISVDPSKRKTGGALLGDRIRMNAINNPRVYMRSLATRQANLALSKHVQESIDICKAAGFDLIIVETSGIGQSDTMITDYCDVSLYVMTPEFGAATQLEKIDMLDFADLVALNKYDKRGALDAIRDVRKQYKRNHHLFSAKDDELPVYGTMASQFNDPGMNTLFTAIMKTIKDKTGTDLLAGAGSVLPGSGEESEKVYIIPPDRNRYLAEIAESSKAYDDWVNEQCKIAQQLFQVKGVMELMAKPSPEGRAFENKKVSPTGGDLEGAYLHLEAQLHPECKRLLKEWPETVKKYKAENFIYKVRDKEIKQPLYYISLSQLQIPKIALPRYEAWGDVLRWLLTENVPGEFPYAAGVFPLKREGEDPTRMFAGEGGPERTNKRFHYVSLGQPAHRLSTAFDSVTLYGEDPHTRPDIYGKIGNSGVSIATLDDAKKLYSGFDLCKPSTSVSMTINGPAPMLLGFFMNAAIDQQCEKYIKEHGLEHLVEAKFKDLYDDKGLGRPRYNSTLPAPPKPSPEGRALENKKVSSTGGDLEEAHNGLGLMLLGLTGDQVLTADVYEKIKAYAISTVRGTVQADILKEDQAQNTCIFSTEFALRMMGDMQQYFITEKVRNFYSVSISGYHIAEAGANPITQLAFTLSNGFTYVEYYLSRGMHIDDFAPNLSFFFSNGIDPEYSVIGRVARRIWAKAIKNKYKGNDRSQKLKYHIQTSGRSLHAQEIDFNDIRTTLQALYAIYDNCNSLHTNAYDEAVTTPTEESVRRAMAIQLIINRELGLAKNENPIQGAFIIEELTDLVEQAVLTEFKAINDRGGVLGAMETMYQRGKIQEESLYYETLKHNGEYPIIGVNTFLNKKGSPTIVPSEVIRATEDEKQYQIEALHAFQQRNQERIPELLKALQHAAIAGDNIFESLMEACKYCSLGQISHALYEVGGQYRRNM
ncbi:methylmalonyl-CoA mutase [Mucilaginibacter lappiensis]|uniref:Fused isobutyryl-CoA mutase n=1 Tax=Mucilaginibacter lappiensis TaxID=354630 RepID=A0ABR6PSV3_9SPHI|nr:methylmalonyl-CoA mutase family protein [Mucilaginibacter lappiensis]MBB6112862.1 methylmalonyl-CoA mutase [Mucilaginibacter lappiensis]SIS07964.1 methylmalonyl-CoA mutase [Mucilaginibacter lappiensis]